MTQDDTKNNKETERQKTAATTAAAAAVAAAGGVSGSGDRRADDSLAGAGRHPRRLIFAPGDVEAPPSSSHSAPSTTATTTSRTATMSPSVSDTNDLPPPPLTTTTTTTSPLRHPSVPTPDSDADLLPASTSASIPLPISSSVSGPGSGTSTPSANAAVVAHPSRAHQFVTNPPLTFAQLDRASPLHQFHAWFRDARLLPSLAPETCTLATASLPSGRVSARIVYLKELDERGWVVYSNWGSRAGKGGQVFGKEWRTVDEAARVSKGGGEGGGPSANDEFRDDDDDGLLRGNRWAALTFHWPTVERQVRIEGLVEPLRREESETYWRVRERGSQLGAWASQQSQVLWSTEPSGSRSAGTDGASTITAATSATAANGNPDGAKNNDDDDCRSLLDSRVEEMEKRFANTEEIPLPPFWGGARLVPESVEFWQGRKSRLHDRFRYVRVHTSAEESAGEKSFRWRIERLSP